MSGSGRYVDTYLLRGDFGDIDLYILLQIIPVQILRHLVHEVESVADVNEWSRVRQLGFHEKGLHLGWIIHCRVTTHTLHLFELLHACGTLNVLLVYQRRLREVHHSTCTHTIRETDVE
jgi:hypothetical protein